MSFFDDAISTIGKGLAQTATKELSDATGYDIGGTLNFLFGDNQTTGGENLSDLMSTIQQDFKGNADQLNFLQETLSQQGQMLMDIGGQLSSISESINSISIEITHIENLLIQIKNQQLFTNWQIVDNQITVYSTAISSAYKTYANYIQNYLTTPTTEIQLLLNDILNVNNGPIVGMNGISTFILDNGMQKGALQLWSNMVCALVEAGVMDYRDAVSQYMNYYKKLAFAQLTATNLVMEAYNLSGDPTSSANFYTTYKQTILSQEETFISWLMPIINAGITGGVSSTDNFAYVLPALDATMQINPNFATLENYTEYYNPSPILNDAEAMLSALYNTDIADRRIVVYMTYFAYGSMNNLLQNVTISLDPTDNTTPVQPDYNKILGPFQFPIDPAKFARYPDLNWDGDFSGYYIKRFIYKANEQSINLPDKSFTLNNLNGMGNLVPQSTYATIYNNGGPYGAEAPFMANSITSYVLTVDETTNFDFMNFLAYNLPSPLTYSAEL